MREDARPHRLPELLDVLGRSVPIVDEEVTVHLGHLCTADAEPAASRLVDEAPRARSRGILECRAAGALFDRLIGLPITRNLVHLLQYFCGLSGRPGEQRLREDPPRRNSATAIRELHVGPREHMYIALRINRAR